MDFIEMKKVIENLAQSQGTYSRMLYKLKQIEKEEREVSIINNWLKERNIKDPVDLIIALES
jgi:hypothetical protein